MDVETGPQDEAARQEAEANRRERARARRALERETAQAEAEEDKHRRQAERDSQRRSAEQERAVRDAEREADKARREAERKAADAELARTRAELRLAAARERAAAAGLTEPDGLPPGFGAMWRTPEQGRRGPRPGLTVPQIVTAGIRLADAEGLGALSMARLAEELGVTTMALYRYVAGKDELVAAMFDAAIGRPPEPLAGGWRAALDAWCRAQLARAADHTWLGELGAVTAFGPGRIGWLEAGLRALDGTPLSQAERTAVVGRLSLHLLGEMQLAAAARRSAGAEPGHPALVDYATLLTLLTDPETSPAIHAALAEGAFGPEGAIVGEAEAAGADDEYLGFGLDLLLDGVAALVERAGRR